MIFLSNRDSRESLCNKKLSGLKQKYFDPGGARIWSQEMVDLYSNWDTLYACLDRWISPFHYTWDYH